MQSIVIILPLAIVSLAISVPAIADPTALNYGSGKSFAAAPSDGLAPGARKTVNTGPNLLKVANKESLTATNESKATLFNKGGDNHRQVWINKLAMRIFNLDGLRTMVFTFPLL